MKEHNKPALTMKPLLYMPGLLQAIAAFIPIFSKASFSPVLQQHHLPAMLYEGTRAWPAFQSASA